MGQPDSRSTRPDSTACRSCRALVDALVLELGEQPGADDLLEPSELEAPERVRPLRVGVCTRCWLVQLVGEGGEPAGAHGHGAAFSTTVLAHLTAWAEELIERRRLTASDRVLDVASRDGHLLRTFSERGMAVLGLDADSESAEAAVPTRDVAFGRAAARALHEEGLGAKLVLVNHALAHVEDLDDFVAGLELVLAPGGAVAFEFHHVLGLAEGQFDIVCHPHRSYLSLLALEAALVRNGLTLIEAEENGLHGGSVRCLATRTRERPRPRTEVAALLERERGHGLDRPAGYSAVQKRATAVRGELLAFLRRESARGASVAAYGAPARGVVLLNFCSVTTELVGFTVDRSPAKQGRFLPGSRLPVLPPSALEEARPEYVLVLPWPLLPEISEQMSVVRSWGGKFVVAMPELQVLA